MRPSRTTLSFALVLLTGAMAFGDPVPQSGRAQAGRDLYAEIGGNELTRQALEALVSVAARDPRVAPYEGIVRVWLDGSLASSHFGDDMAAYYSKTFTEKELREIIDFLRTPTGRKFVAQMPAAIQQAANLSAALMEANRTTLEELLVKRKSSGPKH